MQGTLFNTTHQIKISHYLRIQYYTTAFSTFVTCHSSFLHWQPTMTCYKSAIVLLTFFLFGPSNAFQLPSKASLVSSLPRNVLTLKMSEMNEVEKLRAAAAKAREEYERLSRVRLQFHRSMRTMKLH